eukprot:9291403-Heterocapsa_arctica.AAC.1
MLEKASVGDVGVVGWTGLGHLLQEGGERKMVEEMIVRGGRKLTLNLVVVELDAIPKIRGK